MHNGECGSVTIGSTLFSYLDDLVENFIMLHPNISIKTVSGSADLLQRELLNGGIDLIISTYPYSDTDFKEIPIFKEPMGVCMAKDHPLADKESLSIQDLHYEKFIINNPSSDKSNQTMRVCEAAGFIPNVIFEGMMPRTCGALVSKHRGIMVLCKSRFSYMKMKFKEEYLSLIHIYQTPPRYGERLGVLGEVYVLIGVSRRGETVVERHVGGQIVRQRVRTEVERAAHALHHRPLREPGCQAVRCV